MATTSIAPGLVFPTTTEPDVLSTRMKPLVIDKVKTDLQ